jgi:hypothetical protein
MREFSSIGAAGLLGPKKNRSYWRKKNAGSAIEVIGVCQGSGGML